MAEISIIVPVYNVEKYLENCIESILNQTFKDFELILVDDGSTDNSGKICDIYKKKDSRIKVIHKNNGGLSSARNAGLDIACGKYVGFVDSDDYIHYQMYEKLYHQIIKNKADISVCGFQKVKQFEKDLLSTNKFYEKVELFNNIEALEQLYCKYSTEFVVSWNKLYIKTLFKDIKFKEGAIHEDEFIIHQLLYKVNKVVYNNEKLYFYLQRKGSIVSSEAEVYQIDKIYALSDRIKFFYDKNLTDLTYKTEKIYMWKIFSVYSYLNNFYSSSELLKLRIDFYKLIKIFRKNRIYTLKERISWVIFCITPSLYYKITKNI